MSKPPTTHEIILDLLASADDLLALATRLEGKEGEWYQISKVTKAERPPMVIADYCEQPVHHEGKTVPCSLQRGHSGDCAPSKLGVANGLIVPREAA